MYTPEISQIPQSQGTTYATAPVFTPQVSQTQYMTPVSPLPMETIDLSDEKVMIIRIVLNLLLRKEKEKHVVLIV